MPASEPGRRPPLARVTSVSWDAIVPTSGDERFRIIESSASLVPNAAVSVDSATCEECLSEVDDPDDRRHGYPFTNCTNCGAALHNRALGPLRPPRHDHGRIPDVRPVPG